MSQELVNKWIEITGQQPPRSTVENNYYQAVLKAYEEKDVKTLLINYHLAANNLDVVESDSEQLKIKLHQCELANHNLQDQLQTLLNEKHNQEAQQTPSVSNDLYSKGTNRVDQLLWKGKSSAGQGGSVVLFSPGGKLIVNGELIQSGYEGSGYGYAQHARLKRYSGVVNVSIVKDGKLLKFKTSSNYIRQDGVNSEGKFESYGPHSPWTLTNDGYTMRIENAGARAQMK